jgi:hypothetical protein
MVDLAPHIAMMGSELIPANPSFISNLSVLTQDGSVMGSQVRGQDVGRNHPMNSEFNTDPIVPQRTRREEHLYGAQSNANDHAFETPDSLNFIRPQSTDPADNNYVHRYGLPTGNQYNINQVQSDPNNHLSSHGRTLAFQIPIMLNPGEL